MDAHQFMKYNTLRALARGQPPAVIALPPETPSDVKSSSSLMKHAGLSARDACCNGGLAPPAMRMMTEARAAPAQPGSRGGSQSVYCPAT